jgi:hypothetical protein
MKNPFRRRGQGTAETGPIVVIYEPLTPAEVGAEILARYQHPDSWADGRSTGKPHLIGKKVLKVEEIRLGGMAFVDEQTARDNAGAIRAWVGSVGLATYHVTFDQQYDKAPYVVVPEQYFEEPVLPHLQALARPEEA